MVTLICILIALWTPIGMAVVADAISEDYL